MTGCNSSPYAHIMCVWLEVLQSVDYGLIFLALTWAARAWAHIFDFLAHYDPHHVFLSRHPVFADIAHTLKSLYFSKSAHILFPLSRTAQAIVPVVRPIMEIILHDETMILQNVVERYASGGRVGPVRSCRVVFSCIYLSSCVHSAFGVSRRRLGEDCITYHFISKSFFLRFRTLSLIFLLLIYEQCMRMQHD